MQTAARKLIAREAAREAACPADPAPAARPVRGVRSTGANRADPTEQVATEALTGRAEIGRTDKEAVGTSRRLPSWITWRLGGRLGGGIAALLVLFFKPYWVLGVLFLLVWIAILAHVVLGGERLRAGGAWLASRYPERTKRLRAKAQQGVDRVESWMARLPARWTDGVYLPDFSPEAEASGPDPFERLQKTPPGE